MLPGQSGFSLSGLMGSRTLSGFLRQQKSSSGRPLFALKRLGGQPRGYTFSASPIYRAKSFIGLDLYVWPVKEGGAILPSQRQVAPPMKEDVSPRGVVRFSAFEVDLRNGELRKHGFKIKLQDQPFHILHILLEHPGQLVTREELQRQIWPADTFVDFEKGLNNAIKRLRDALGDSAEQSRYIETHSRRGYRFIGSLQGSDGDSLAPMARAYADDGRGQISDAPQTSTNMGHRTIASLVETVTEYRRAKRVWMAIAGVLGVCGLAFILALLAFPNMTGLRERVFGASAVPPIHSIAVLPLENLSSDPAQEYFSDGMTDALITDLAQIASLTVISRTSSMQYKQTKKSLPQIARELNVDGIIEGTVQRSGDRVRITAQLIHGPTDRHLWANSYERDTRDVLALEQDVTEDIARQIRARLTITNRPERPQPWPMDPKALEAYLQGRFHYNLSGKGFGDEEKRTAAQYFEQAIAADPNFAPAYNWLALAHENLLLGSREDVAIARRAAEKGIEVDPRYSVARVSLAALKWQPLLDWRGAEQEFRRAISVDSNEAYGHSGLGILLIALGRIDEGMRECRIAQRLDPFDDDSALCLYYGRDYDGSIAMFQMLLQGDPKVGVWHCNLFPDYAMKGMHKEFIQELQQCFSLFGQSEAAANIQHGFASSGYQGAIQQWAREVEHLQAAHKAFLPGHLAEAYAILGDKDRAFYWLGQAYERREMESFDSGVFYLGAEPMYDPLRSDARFKELLRRVGLPP